MEASRLILFQGIYQFTSLPQRQVPWLIAKTKVGSWSWRWNRKQGAIILLINSNISAPEEENTISSDNRAQRWKDFYKHGRHHMRSLIRITGQFMTNSQVGDGGDKCSWVRAAAGQQLGKCLTPGTQRAGGRGARSEGMCAGGREQGSGSERKTQSQHEEMVRVQ